MMRFRRALAILASAFALMGYNTCCYGASFEVKKLDDGTAVIFISGAIENGDDVKLRRLSVENPQAIIALDSAGGKLMPAIEMGKVIRLAGYATIVGEDFVCTSSCALIWLAGSPRYLEPKGRVGFHASYRDNNGQLEETGVGNAIIGHYLSLLNLSQKSVVFTTTASPSEITWLTEQNRVQAGIEYQTLSKVARPLPEARRNIAAADLQQATPLVQKISGSSSNALKPVSEYTLEDFRQLFQVSSSNPRVLRAELAKLNLNSDSLDLLVAHSQILFANTQFLDRIAQEMNSAKGGFSGRASDREIALSIGQATNIRLSLEGITRLPDSDVRKYFGYILMIANRATDAECKAVFSGKDDYGRIELRLLASLGKQELSDYLALTRRAIFAELANNPAKIALSKVEIEAGEKALENYLIQNLEKLAEADKLRIATAMTDFEGANDKDSCDGYYLIFKSINDLGGLPGIWSRRNLANSIASDLSSK